MLRNVSDPSLTVFTPAPAKANGAGTVQRRSPGRAAHLHLRRPRLCVGKRGLPVDRWTDLPGDWLADQGFA
jgi:hypothetical protein